MIAGLLGPTPEEVGEVPDVVGNQDAPLMCGQGQNVRIIKALEVLVLVEGKDVVAALSQLASYRPSR